MTLKKKPMAKAISKDNVKLIQNATEIEEKSEKLLAEARKGLEKSLELRSDFTQARELLKQIR